MFTRRSLKAKNAQHFVPAADPVEPGDVEMKEAVVDQNVTSVKTEPVVDNEQTKSKENETSTESTKREHVTKLNKKERRIRRNNRLEKLVRPKNAIMVLNELTNSTAMKFEEIPGEDGLFGMAVTIEGNTYQGYAPSKNGAKQKASERALKEYMTEKIRKRQLAGEIEPYVEVSWSHLASFALHKLFDSWQDVSDLLHPEKEKQVTAKQLKPAKTLPFNASNMHPVMLFNQMCPGISITDVSCTGQAPNISYTVQIVYDGNTYQGSGSNKKTARKICAQKVMETHFNVKFDSA